MNVRLVEEIADAVLYEGYILYPYRPSALKNQHRFNFGVVAPVDPIDSDASATTGEKSALQAECVVNAPPASVLTIRVRFLQLVERTADPAARSWQEAIEREVRVTVPVGGLTGATLRWTGDWPAERDTETLRSADGQTIGTLVREKEHVAAAVAVYAALLDGDLFKITLSIGNVTPPAAARRAGRDAWLMRSLVSTHAILQIDGGEFLSLVDPPDTARAAVESCRQIGLWPVLVGDAQDRDGLLASPIILYDYPQIAPESAGDFCDGTEIDEMLALRILTMTDDEKLEMRQGDERGRRMLERTEHLSEEHFMKLHGVLRGLRSIDGDGGR